MSVQEPGSQTLREQSDQELRKQLEALAGSFHNNGRDSIAGVLRAAADRLASLDQQEKEEKTLGSCGDVSATAPDRTQERSDNDAPHSGDDDDYPTVTCPKCGDEATDLDGFGFVACTVCGYCTHPSRTGGICGICGHAEPDEQTAIQQVASALRYWQAKKLALDAARPDFSNDQLRELNAAESRLLAIDVVKLASLEQEQQEREREKSGVLPVTVASPDAREERSATDAPVSAPLWLPYERVQSAVLQQAVMLREGEHLLVLQPFGWHLDGRHIPNMAEQFSREYVCQELRYQVAYEFGPYIAIVQAVSVGAAQLKESL